ncbi:hypothetical protein M378DRAFT_12062 [Amanita muscaria Koide BX008]|uniref:Uncharacterized protein n=1 Tax=Amanita muscaria (strain Koide BX008) TaxID=946122 RepID=A0A0C2WPR1_AMAMK|nr:hypothetical protein M378DRAFT_12062 [Amanita muscaria Koide BX008]
MLQENLKRPVSTSPVGCPNRDLKRPHLATVLWSEDEHLQQDDMVKQRLEGLYLDTKDKFHMAWVTKTVADVAFEGPYSHLFHVPAHENCLGALKDSVLMKLVGDCYTNGSYKNVRLHGASILALVAINFSNISASPGFLLKNPASAFTQNSGEKDKVADIFSSHSGALRLFL